MEAFSISKFFGGFLNWYKILFIVIIIAVCLGVYHKLFIQRTESHITQAPQAQAIYHVQAPKIDNWGCNNYRVLEYSKEKK